MARFSPSWRLVPTVPAWFGNLLNRLPKRLRRFRDGWWYFTGDGKLAAVLPDEPRHWFWIEWQDVLPRWMTL